MKELITQNLIRTFLVMILAAGWNLAAAQHWTVDPADYQYDMSLYAKFMQRGVQFDYDVVEVAAFVGDECRGVGTKLTLPDDDYVMLMRIRSNVESGETITFKYFNPEYDEAIAIEGYELPFEAGTVVGFPSDPLIVKVPTVGPILATSVTLDKTEVTLLIGQSETITATIEPEDTTDKTLEWNSSNPDVATVDDNGMITAISSGQTTITVGCGDAKAKCQVTVNKKDQTITWKQDLDNLKVDDAITLEATASSGLQVAFQIISGSEFATIQEDKLMITAAGSIQVQASQDGNEEYNAAEPIVKTILATNAISELMSEGISVTTQGGAIVVYGLSSGASIAVYDLAGSLVYSGIEHRVPATSGTAYIVVAGNCTFKVIAD